MSGCLVRNTLLCMHMYILGTTTVAFQTYQLFCVFSPRCVCVGNLFNCSAAILLAGERSSDQSAGVWSPTPQTSALPTCSVLNTDPLLGLWTTWPTGLLSACLLLQVCINAPFPFHDTYRTRHCSSCFWCSSTVNFRTYYCFLALPLLVMVSQAKVIIRGDIRMMMAVFTHTLCLKPR